jgi:conjugal transfer/entry exclusion protein
MKTVFGLITIAILAGCAGQPQRAYQSADLSRFVANCPQARSQIEFLNKEINAYLAYHATVPVTIEDQRYYGKLKNNIWSLRSTCNAQYL